MKTHLFQSCGHCWVFQICWHIECSTFTASSFRIWNSSTGIPSPPLALFIVMVSNAHLTSHSRMSGSRWVIIPSWLPWLWRSFFYSSSGASLVAQRLKRLPAMQEIRVQSLGREDPLEKEMATHTSILAWEYHGRRSLVSYSPWVTKSWTQLSDFTFCVFLPPLLNIFCFC